MAEIVAAINCAHAPGIATLPQPDPAGMKQRVYAAYAAARERLAEARPTALLVVSNEHLQNWFFDNWPALAIAYPEQVQGPAETWMPLPQVTLPGLPKFGHYLVEASMKAHFDVASSRDIRPDHGVFLPLHHLRPEADLPLAVVYQNCVQPPLPTMQRCYEFGQFLGRAIREWPGNERFALIGVGGISHWIGIKGTGRINDVWDRHILDLVCRGQGDEIAAISPEEIEREGGNGGEEIRNWLAVMGAIGNRPGDLIGYEAVLEWICGAAVVWFDMKAATN